MFERIDENFDKRISIDEFKKAIPEINKWGVQIEDPEETFKEIDADGAGMLLFDEFCKWAI
jgi:Ca2+-binding EF-hand superfamily protein